MTDAEEKEDEILALSNIYDESVLTISQEGDEPGGQFSASFILPQPFFVKASVLQKSDKKNEDPKEVIEETKECHPIKFLPPIILNFTLPPSYPSQSPPRFTLSCKWLTRHQLSKLCQELDALWERNSGMVILFTWTSFLLDEALDFLEVQSPLDISQIVSPVHSRKAHKDGSQAQQSDFDPRGIQDIGSQALLLPFLLDHNKKCLQEEFEKSIHPCLICFADKFGIGCMRFHGCNHVFCKQCMANYFTVQIKEGNVQSLTCSWDKCSSEASPLQVKELVSEELYKRYDQLLLQKGLDTMMDIVYCPRPCCRMPVLMEKEQNMGRCANCFFIFCPHCKMVYHGLSPCKLKADEMKKIREEYVGADESTKAVLEKRYGKKIINRILEEAFSNEWLDKFSKQCPSCSTHIEKIDGCNKMTCTKCRTYFCWICQAVLSRSNPYGHFSVAGTNCNGLLFEGMEDGMEDDRDFDWVEYD